MSDNEASHTLNDISTLSEQQGAVAANILPTPDEWMAKDNDDNDQDANFLEVDDLGPSEEPTQGTDNGDEDIDNALAAMHVDGAEEGDNLPWDKASCAKDPLPPQPTPCYNLQPTRSHSYGHKLALHMNSLSGTKSYDPHVQLLQLATINIETCPGNMFSYSFGFMMNQMMASQGICKHRQKAINALFSKFCQLDDKVVFDPVDVSTLTKDQKKATLRAINLIKEKSAMEGSKEECVPMEACNAPCTPRRKCPP